MPASTGLNLVHLPHAPRQPFDDFMRWNGTVKTVVMMRTALESTAQLWILDPLIDPLDPFNVDMHRDPRNYAP